jgi:hypothetical protein
MLRIQSDLYVVIDNVIMSIQYLNKCWQSLKLTKLQRKNEISLSVNVAKAEKIS